ncbi:retrovirus-related pol polyprotein from transposon TNT 1-94 [Tanacetum coccineum]
MLKSRLRKRALHKMEYDIRVNERQTQTTEEKVDSSKAFDASLISTISDVEPNGRGSKRLVKSNVFAIGQQHTEQPELNNEGEASFLKDIRRQIMTTLTSCPQDKIVVPTAKRQFVHNKGIEFLFSPLLEEYYNPTNGIAEKNNNDQAQNASFQEDEFINPFCTRYREIGDHPLEQVRGNPTMPVQTRRQLATYPEMFARWKQFGFLLPTQHTSLFQSTDGLKTVFLMVTEGKFNVLSQKDRDPDHLEKVYLLRKALYGLKQAPRAWYDELSNFLMSKGFTNEIIDPSLFKIKYGEDILHVPSYVDDI